jgi:two-component system, OmpR family, sensor kinase
VTGTLARRMTLACLLVALLAVVVSALVALRLVGVTARQATAEVLARSADLVAAQPDRAAAVAVLRAQGIAVVAVAPDGRPGPSDPRAREAVRRAGAAAAVRGPVSGVERVDGTTVLVEARPVPGGAVALVADADPPSGGVVRRNLALAFVAGGLVAVVVGFALARLLSRPLRRTAAAAHLLRTGRRDVRVPVEGPAEIAEVATAVNDLVTALARSEARQREFLLSVSHELRTPLTAVRGFGESVADGVVTGPDAEAAGRIVVDEALRLERLVADLLDLAGMQAGDFRLDLVEVDLVGLLDAAAAVWGARCAAAGVVFDHVAPPGPVPVLADPQRLRQVVDALADNALRLTPPGAPVRVVLHAEPVRLEVRDGGPGLGGVDVPDAFRRGALHERHRGTGRAGAAGVGLALVHGLVTRMGGTVAVDRAPEGGARFTVSLRAPGSDRAPGAVAPPPEDPLR